jgi:SAM-dependent methyltransferase
VLSWLRRARRRLEEKAFELGVDRLAYRFWRYRPAGLRLWYGHLRFDRRFGVETRGYSDWRHEPTPAELFRKMMEKLPAPVEGLTFVDFGSGKGKAVLLAAAFAFRRVIGIELWPDLHEIAQENLRRYRGELRCRSVELLCCDAADYSIPEEPAVLYFFNPFKESVLSRVLENVRASLARNPRPLFVIFYAPVRRGTPWDRRHLFDGAPFLKRLHDEPAFAIYSNA